MVVKDRRLSETTFLLVVEKWWGQQMARSLIFLFDGTDNDPTDSSQSQPTNVFNLNSLIAESRNENGRARSQVTFYLPGIGTKFYARGSLSRRLRQLIFGVGLDEMVMRSYVNLAANFRDADQIVVIGFSRGAVAARLFARLISDFGVLQSREIAAFSEMYEIFEDACEQNYSEYINTAKLFHEKYSKQLREPTPQVHFMGLFDCVCGPLDRDYANFVRNIDRNLSENVVKFLHLMSLHDVREHFPLCRLRPKEDQGEEIWMPGVHSDVGGGYSDDLIARVSLKTMAYALQRSKVALQRVEYGDLSKSIFMMLKTSRTVINHEGRVEYFRKHRTDYFDGDDKLHHLHKWLIGRRVRWKDEGETTYEDRLAGATDVSNLTESAMARLLPP
ncbi:T6SS phospholipase effector Tle1-like catalytic domain-containing protein [Sinorhizobium meliloti]|uniref:T6SS phospholipase effector Tle1-like catalytic domain-containing protein n=1 Tax=Rhizobium meliloti TaxID=382 RepID=UPI000FDB2927|nr:DUF2235 domain-containing protein [Sinorhizobium meliloti]MCO6425691.1 DUF2235 domain-containing protein [Sinorhizobium meliloti]RVL38715.1 DUF2235 domain-containing protein [Sinorhizobium meliloti]